jgi:hypothetical protein
VRVLISARLTQGKPSSNARGGGNDRGLTDVINERVIDPHERSRDRGRNVDTVRIETEDPAGCRRKQSSRRAGRRRSLSTRTCGSMVGNANAGLSGIRFVSGAKDDHC